MKQKLIACWKTAAAAGLLITFAVTLPAQTTLRYDSQPGGKVRIDGTSTRSDWSAEGQLIGGFIELEPGYLTDRSQPAAADAKSKPLKPNLEVTIPVRSLRSGNRIMDQVMHDAMKIKEHPRIEYRIDEMVPKDIPSDAMPLKLDTKGKLTVAGVTRPIEMEVQLEHLAEDRLKFTGETAFKMSDFGITPPSPSLAFGLLRTGDEVKISFEWLTARRDR